MHFVHIVMWHIFIICNFDFFPSVFVFKQILPMFYLFIQCEITNDIPYNFWLCILFTLFSTAFCCWNNRKCKHQNLLLQEWKLNKHILLDYCTVCPFDLPFSTHCTCDETLFRVSLAKQLVGWFCPLHCMPHHSFAYWRWQKQQEQQPTCWRCCWVCSIVIPNASCMHISM